MLNPFLGNVAPGTRNWRATLMAALIVLLIVMAMLMKWLVQFQVDAAKERRALESLAREAEARCFALASYRATEACRAAHAARVNPQK
ncbi:general secretion pathway protein GspL [Variovorax paradoxus]|jgi:hypothetical protein|uniref:general secretion pathway protein GspL n=1 Tax=Variovorax paradoxus TaxID=34073 RepID=UPI002480FA2F|nr:general secretion pathway protein GspL [Variovorax paradoxus]WGT66219.1 general secretion pathway protein GspL [Variovorax paradoxus]